MCLARWIGSGGTVPKGGRTTLSSIRYVFSAIECKRHCPEGKTEPPSPPLDGGEGRGEEGRSCRTSDASQLEWPSSPRLSPPAAGGEGEGSSAPFTPSTWKSRDSKLKPSSFPALSTYKDSSRRTPQSSTGSDRGPSEQDFFRFSHDPWFAVHDSESMLFLSSTFNRTPPRFGLFSVLAFLGAVCKHAPILSATAARSFAAQGRLLNGNAARCFNML